MAHPTHRHRRPPRPGFSLIEMLVAISIIALLFSLGGAAYQRIRIAQMVKTTEDVVNKVQGGVDDQVQVLADAARQGKIQRTPEFTGLLNYCGGDPDRAEALLLYCKVKQAFPQTLAELNARLDPPQQARFGFTVGGVNFERPPAFSKLAALPTTPNAPPPDLVAAACLYAALTERTIGGKVFDSDAGTSGRHLDTAVNGTPVRVYRDAWDHPVSFVRFHQSAELDRAPYAREQSVFKNPFDPLGKLAQAWPNKTDAETRLGTAFNNRNKALLVYSVGRNGVLNNFDLDDVLGYKLRSAGARGAKQP